MNSIGLRCNPGAVYFSVCKSNNEEIELIAVDKIIVPISLEMPEKLKFIRSTLLDIIDEYKVSTACIRITEPTARKINLDRIYLEAVIQELIASSSIKKYYIGQISSISAKLEIPRENFKKYISGEMNYESIVDWGSFTDVQKESILSSLSALNI